MVYEYYNDDKDEFLTQVKVSTRVYWRLKEAPDSSIHYVNGPLSGVIYWNNDMFQKLFKVMPRLFKEAVQQESLEFSKTLGCLIKEIHDNNPDYEQVSLFKFRYY